MGLTLAQLIEEKTREEILAELLLSMQGVGYVKKEGSGEGWLSLSGVATAAQDVVVKITGAGALGVALFQYSLDGGTTFNGTNLTVPSGGQYVLATTGVTLIFESGPGELVESFHVNDTYSFSLSVPTLPTTSWHAGSTALTIVETDAAANEDVNNVVRNVAKGAYLSTAYNAWLDLYIEEVYDLERHKGVAAQHTVLLTDTAGNGPFSILPGQLIFATALGLRFSNVNGGTLPQNGTLSLTAQAEQKGVVYNVAVGAINLMLTSLPGVSVTNPDLGGATSITQQGVNRETDAEAKIRAPLRWPSLSGDSGVEGSLKLRALEASTSVKHALPEADPIVGGKQNLYIAGPSGAVAPSVVSDVQDALEPWVTLGSILEVISATNFDVALVATAYVAAGYSSTALAAINTNLAALFQGGLNSIGEELPGIGISDGTGKVYFAQVLEQLQLSAGVRNVTLTLNGGTVDLTIPSHQVARLSPAPSITMVEV